MARQPMAGRLLDLGGFCEQFLSHGIASDSIKRSFLCEHVQRALIKDLGAGWEGAIHHGRQEFSTEQLVQCFADNIGRPVSLSVRRGTKQTLRLKVVPQRAC